jgi:mutator protein MutT
MKNTVVASAIIKNEKGEVLLLHYDKEKEEGVLIPPGGKLELGESARKAAKREAKEELGIDIKIEKLIGISELVYDDSDEAWVFLFYSATIVNGIPQPMENEREDGKTFGVDYYPIDKMNHFKAIHWID